MEDTQLKAASLNFKYKETTRSSRQTVWPGLKLSERVRFHTLGHLSASITDKKHDDKT